VPFVDDEYVRRGAAVDHSATDASKANRRLRDRGERRIVTKHGVQR
jgi:hypothetical protein